MGARRNAGAVLPDQKSGGYLTWAMTNTGGAAIRQQTQVDEGVGRGKHIMRIDGLPMPSG